MLSMTIKGNLTVGKRIFAGICNWRDIDSEEKTITCAKLISGEVVYGTLIETDLPKKYTAIEEAIKLLKNNGYKIVKE